MDTFHDFLIQSLPLCPPPHNPNTKQELYWILETTFNLTRPQIMMQLQDKISDQSALDQAKACVVRLIKGEPIAYILGETSFLGQKYICEPPVLIPRPETEIVVQKISEALNQTLGTNPFILFELGAGTGCMSIELAKAFPSAIVHSWDISEKAIDCARKNKAYHGVQNLKYHHGDYFKAQDYRALILSQHNYPHVVISNPPYISEIDYETLSDSVKTFEDKRALVAQNEGLAIYQKLFDCHKTEPKLYGFELGINQSETLKLPSTIIQTYAQYGYKDLNNIQRVMLLIKK